MLACMETSIFKSETCHRKACIEGLVPEACFIA